MENKISTVESIGLFIDGGYYAKVNEALEDVYSANINMTALITYIRKRISEISGTDFSACHITESHYFRGRYGVNAASGQHLLYDERKFEDTMIENDVIFHYKPLRQVRENGVQKIIEKGIDVWFALEAYELATIRKFDYVVLITGDADHEMLIKKLKALKIYTILLTWDVPNGKGTSTAALLKEETCMHMELGEIAREDKELIKSICRPVFKK